jgi:Peptidase C39 family
MNTRIFSGIIAIVLLGSGIAVADKPLERAELLQIFEQLTAQPRKTWIAAGTIEAAHQEYKAAAVTDENEINRQIAAGIKQYRNESNKQELTEELQKMKLDATPFNIRHELSNEYTMQSTEIVKFDGTRFYWEINVDSRSDSVKPGRDLAGNDMTEQFDLGGNQRRIFAWDGEEYTTYFLPGNNAIVDATGKSPRNVNGPLTAGVVPWGYGRYTYSNLCAVESSGMESTVNGETQIVLTLKEANGGESRFTLDSAKNYALINCLIEKPDGSTISRQYSNYVLIAGGWIPKTIVIEHFDAGSDKPKARDLWNITAIDSNVLQANAFDVLYEQDAMIEYYSDEGTKPTVYRQSNATDTGRLLAKRLAIIKSDRATARNCATIGIGYVASELGVTIQDSDLASLVNQTKGTTSLYDMKYFLQGFGFYCRAVKTDINALKNLNGCKAILHFPGKNHFVVVDRIDDRCVWITDLSSPKLYERTEISFFDMDWTNGTALIVSKQPIPGDFNEISSGESADIVGGSGYSCTKLFQQWYYIPCDQSASPFCGGKYYEYFTRYGCEAADSGSCSSTKMVKFMSCPCIYDFELDGCVPDCVYTSYFMMACPHD